MFFASLFVLLKNKCFHCFRMRAWKQNYSWRLCLLNMIQLFLYMHAFTHIYTYKYTRYRIYTHAGVIIILFHFWVYIISSFARSFYFLSFIGLFCVFILVLPQNGRKTKYCWNTERKQRVLFTLYVKFYAIKERFMLFQEPEFFSQPFYTFQQNVFHNNIFASSYNNDINKNFTFTTQALRFYLHIENISE